MCVCISLILSLYIGHEYSLKNIGTIEIRLSCLQPKINENKKRSRTEQVRKESE